jgi:hypothetical protein
MNLPENIKIKVVSFALSLAIHVLVLSALGIAVGSFVKDSGETSQINWKNEETLIDQPLEGPTQLGTSL